MEFGSVLEYASIKQCSVYALKFSRQSRRHHQRGLPMHNDEKLGKGSRQGSGSHLNPP